VPSAAGWIGARYCGVDEVKGFDHVDSPIEEEIDLRRSAARNRAYRLEARHLVDCLLQWASDYHFHLLDRHDAVIDADDDSRKIRLREYFDWDRERFVDSNDRQDNNEKGDRFGVPGKPVVLGKFR